MIGLLADTGPLPILEFSLKLAIGGDKGPGAMHLVIEPVPLIMNIDMTFGEYHLSFAFSFAVLQLASV